MPDLGAVLLGPLVGAAEGDGPRDVGGVELLAPREVEALLARGGRQHAPEAPEPRPEVAPGRRCAWCARSAAATAGRPPRTAPGIRAVMLMPSQLKMPKATTPTIAPMVSSVPSRTEAGAGEVAVLLAPGARLGLERGDARLQGLAAGHVAAAGLEGAAGTTQEGRHGGGDRVHLGPARLTGLVGDGPGVAVARQVDGPLLGGPEQRRDESLVVDRLGDDVRAPRPGRRRPAARTASGYAGCRSCALCATKAPTTPETAASSEDDDEPEHAVAEDGVPACAPREASCRRAGSGSAGPP